MGDSVFVSYARLDQDFVLQLAQALKEQGVSIWIDQWDIPVGANWNRSIDDAIRNSNKFLIVLSAGGDRFGKHRSWRRAAARVGTAQRDSARTLSAVRDSASIAGN